MIQKKNKDSILNHMNKNGTLFSMDQMQEFSTIGLKPAKQYKDSHVTR